MLDDSKKLKQMFDNAKPIHQNPIFNSGGQTMKQKADKIISNIIKATLYGNESDQQIVDYYSKEVLAFAKEIAEEVQKAMISSKYKTLEDWWKENEL